MSSVSLTAPGLRAAVDPMGGRVTSLVVEGHEVLVRDHRSRLYGGSFPMAPWAGRVAHGRFTFDGTSHRLPIRIAPHALHGVVMDQRWTVTETTADRTRLTVDLAQPVTEPDGPYRWPFGGQAEQTVALDAGGLHLTLRVTAGTSAMPVLLGWHPWFRRQLQPDGQPARLHFHADSMYALDGDAIPTGELVPPPAGPWDNCFTGVAQDPVIGWPGGPRLRLTSDCDHWVVFDQRQHAICVEPQTDAPDAFNRQPVVLEPGQSIAARFEILV